MKSLVEGSAAARDGRIQVQDLILAVNGVSLEGRSHADSVAALLGPAAATTSLRLARFHLASPQARYLALLRQQEADTTVVDMEPPSAASPLPPPLPVPVSAPVSDQEPSTSSAVAAPLPSSSVTLPPSPPSSSAQLSLPDPAQLRRKWEPILGPDCDVIVCHVRWGAGSSGGLGLALEGTVDVEGGAEVRPHHYIQSLAPNSPASAAQPAILGGDELLQANSVELWGRSHVEVVSGLSGLRGEEAPVVVLTLGRRRAARLEAAVFQPAGSGDELGHPSTSFAGPSGRSLVGTGESRLVKAKSEVTLWERERGPEVCLLAEVARRLRSKSLEPLSQLAVWCPAGQVVELEKGGRGLGFSVLDYQDPLHPAERIIVIRSLVPGGVAAQDGGVVPGDRLLKVNDTNLENASLETAVRALKGAPAGRVRLLLAKPLPLHQEVPSIPNISSFVLAPSPSHLLRPCVIRFLASPPARHSISSPPFLLYNRASRVPSFACTIESTLLSYSPPYS